MSQLRAEIDGIRDREIHLVDPYEPKDPDGLLRMVFMIPYGHAFSLMGNGPMGLHDLINRTKDVPAVAERALHYECLVHEGNRVTTPDGEVYRSIESPLPVGTADVIGVSVINSGSLHSVFQQLDLAGVPRRSAERIPVSTRSSSAATPVSPTPSPWPTTSTSSPSAKPRSPCSNCCASSTRTARSPEAASACTRSWPAFPACTYRRCTPASTCPVAASPRSPRGNSPCPRRPAPPTSPYGSCTPPTSSTQERRHRRRHPPHPRLPALLRLLQPRRPPVPPRAIEMLKDYIDRLEAQKIRRIIISSPTFTQYRHRRELLDHISAYARRAAAEGETVTTIIGSIRADELTADYLESVTELEEFGHLFTELNLDQARGIITIAPEWASPGLVALYGKTQRRDRVDNAIELCRKSKDVNTVMLYFIVGAPGERDADRLAIADYAQDVLDRLGHPDGTVIVKLHQFMPKPGTASQRLRMSDPDLVHTYTAQIEDRLRALVGDENFEQHFRSWTSAPATCTSKSSAHAETAGSGWSWKTSTPPTSTCTR